MRMITQDKLKKNHPSNSRFQSELEDCILTFLKKEKLPIIESPGFSNLNLEKINHTKFNYKINGCKLEWTNNKPSYLIDIFDEEQNVIGEIYSSLSNKPGQKRKIKSDILKLITIEKAFINSGKTDFKKILIFTINQGELTKNGITHSNKFISLDALKNSSFKDKITGTWLYQTIELFNIHIFYYILDDNEEKDLIETVSNQKMGNH
jgi:hypothetical protein